MPQKRRYNRKKKRVYKSVRKGRNRLSVARVPRPLQLKTRSATQRLVYYNTFICDPKNASGVLGAQQNFCFKIQLNSPWLFPYGWNNKASSSNNQVFVSNQAITAALTDGIDSNTTAMPGYKDGFNLAAQYAKGCVVGTKVTIQATPLQNEQDNQPGLLYAVKHSQANSGLALTSTVNDLQKLPFRRQRRIMGAAAPTSGFTTNNIVSSKLIIKHSPKKFNNVKDLRDNADLFFSTSGGTHSSGVAPNEGDFLTIGLIPQLVDYQVGGSSAPRQTTKCSLSMRVEQTILWTEPLEALTTGTGNYSFPRGAFSGDYTRLLGYAAGYAGSMYALTN